MSYRNYEPHENSYGMSTGAKVTIGVIAVIVLGTLLFFMLFITNVDRGSIGVVFSKTHGGVQSETLPEGWNVIAPVVNNVTEYPVAQVNYTMSKVSAEGKVQGDDSVEFTTSDNQKGNMNVTVSFGVNAPMGPAVYDNFRGEEIGQIENEYIRMKTKAAVQMATTQYTILDVHGSKKAEAAALAKKFLQQLIEDDAKALQAQYAERVKSGGRVPIKPENLERLFNVYSVTFGEDYLPQTVQDYINSKLKAETDRANAETQLKKITIDAQQKVAQAQADLDAAKLAAEATKVSADAEAYKNQVTAKSLTPELLQLKAIEKLNPNVQIMDVPTGIRNLLYGTK